MANWSDLLRAHPSAVRPGRRRPIARRLAAPLVALVVLVSCSDGERPTLAEGSGTSTTTSTSPVELPDGSGAVEPAAHDLPPGPENLVGYIATPIGTAPEVHTAPDLAAERLDIGPTTAVGAPTTFAVIGDPVATSDATDGWYKVLLPTRPNQSTGWVPVGSVELTQTPYRIFIDLGARTLRVENNGAAVFETPVAIGTDDNPTPLGATYVTELIENTDPDGAYGPYAFGLALHSETLTEFAGGPGQVGVHGTDQPDLIGDAVSHGCIRLTNDAIVDLQELGLPLGAPVFIS